MDLKAFLSRRGASKALAVAIGANPVDVSKWKNRKRPVPAKHINSIVAFTNGQVSAEELRPDLAQKWASLNVQREVA